MSKQKPVDELEGRELDAAVAEEISNLPGVDAYSPWGAIFDMDPESRTFKIIPHYSTDITAAQKIKNKADSWYTGSEWDGTNAGAGETLVRAIVEIGDGKGEWVADTEPEAISRATLLAVRDD